MTTRVPSLMFSSRAQTPRAIVVLFGFVAYLVWWQTSSAPEEEVFVPMTTPLNDGFIAICISGASRGEDTLVAFATSLRRYVLADGTRRVQIFGWLQDDVAESQLELLFPTQVFGTTTRRMISSELPLPLRGSEDEALAREHPRATYGRAWIDEQNMSLNTLRMFRKLMGVELIRQLTQTKQIWAPRHSVIIRIRPDLLLFERLQLPLRPAFIWVPWMCNKHELANDQLLIGPPNAFSKVAMIYKELHRRVASASMYPERLMYSALRELSIPLQVHHVRTVLVSQSESLRLATRDPFAKLRHDWPDCEYPDFFDDADINLGTVHNPLLTSRRRTLSYRVSDGIP